MLLMMMMILKFSGNYLASETGFVCLKTGGGFVYFITKLLFVLDFYEFYPAEKKYIGKIK